MNPWKLLLLLPVLLWGACKDDPTAPEDGPPTITITADRDAANPVCAGQSVVFTVLLQGDAFLNDFELLKNGTAIATQNDIIFNNFTITITYLFNAQDLAAGMVTFTFNVSDANGKTATQTITYTVIQEFTFSAGPFQPAPSLDLANNRVLDTADGPNVDLLLSSESDNCGPFCDHQRWTFTSKNDTRFYAIPGNILVNVTSNSYKQADLLAAISGQAGVAELVVYSEWAADATANGNLDRFPIIAHLRNTGEYAVIGRGIVRGTYVYEKRFELAGN